MKKSGAVGLFAVLVCFLLSGCVVRTYQTTRDRIDQDLSAGNRGYLQGQMPPSDDRERKATRTTQVVEVELYPPFKFEKKSAAKTGETEKMPMQEMGQDEALGNRGYIMESAAEEPAVTEDFQNYTVQRGDTLQKISQKFFGTTKKWMKIYDANKDVMKGPNKIYPGQVIKIPGAAKESLKEPSENLK